MNTRRPGFLDVFLRGEGLSFLLVGAFVLGLIVIGVISNLAYDVLISPGDVGPTLLIPLIASVVITLLAYGLYKLDARRQPRIEVTVDESRLAQAMPGLIWLLGPGFPHHLTFALSHHRKGGGGEQCWLIMQKDVEQVERAFLELDEYLLAEKLDVRLHRLYIDKPDAEDTYRAARAIWDREALEQGLQPEMVIGDITGGTKPMTAGLVLAAIAADRVLEYVESDRDHQGRPVEGSERVVLADIGFYLTRESS